MLPEGLGFRAQGLLVLPKGQLGTVPPATTMQGERELVIHWTDGGYVGPILGEPQSP